MSFFLWTAEREFTCFVTPYSGVRDAKLWCQYRIGTPRLGACWVNRGIAEPKYGVNTGIGHLKWVPAEGSRGALAPRIGIMAPVSGVVGRVPGHL